ncbi:MAG: hypothetical protein HOL37_06225 [Rhodospirillaceae bacterium]|jgi:hypothetical protein|nr:hypothetical protein [Rhodospirillaceae bacterium]MBT5013852.1 hypothetical protein [Rhodospirillaceae bacterium]MBT5308912.1 hypothetical protein [Rhodospirillaceae bacterium]MBT7354939.1 hypothetical protein [Rhodospirillaceae bacterium]
MNSGPKLMVHFSDGSLSEFVVENLIAAAIARHLAASQVVGAFRLSSPERAFVVDCNPYIGTGFGVDPDAPATLLIDWFEASMYPVVECPSPEWYERDMHKSDLIILPSMMKGAIGRMKVLRDAPPVFQLPSECSIEPKVPKDTWFACLDGTLAGCSVLADHIASMGGEAVVLNDASPDSMAILSRARFCIGSDAALLALAGAFAVPMAAIGLTDHARVVWRQGDIVVDIGEQDLPGVADRLLAISSDCTGWRRLKEEAPVVVAENIRLPLELIDA